MILLWFIIAILRSVPTSHYQRQHQHTCDTIQLNFKLSQKSKWYIEKLNTKGCWQNFLWSLANCVTSNRTSHISLWVRREERTSSKWLQHSIMFSISSSPLTALQQKYSLNQDHEARGPSQGGPDSLRMLAFHCASMELGRIKPRTIQNKLSMPVHKRQPKYISRLNNLLQ